MLENVAWCGVHLPALSPCILAVLFQVQDSLHLKARPKRRDQWKAMWRDVVDGLRLTKESAV